MKQDGRCRLSGDTDVDPLWDEEVHAGGARGSVEVPWEDDEPTLLAELVVGQALVIDWSEPSPVTYVEEVVRCQTCGEALSESRLALLSMTSRRCPTCGHPASA